jgi:peptidoglycan/LPS O-acetylase OafA/YrhL
MFRVPASASRPSPPAVLDYGAYRALRRFPALDGVRAIAILLVITVHVQHQGLWGHLNGGNGVTIFFVLSGYLITMLALREESERGHLDVRAFFVRRFFRIYPLYVVVLSLYMVLILLLGYDAARRAHFVHELPYYWLGFPEHANSFNPDVAFQVSWSLGIEEKYYLVWPFLAFVLLAARFRARVVACVVLCGVIMTVEGLGRNGVDVLVDAAKVVFPYVHILIGCALALLLHQPRFYRRLRWLGRREPLWAALVLVVVLGLLTRPSGSPFAALPFSIAAAVALTGLVTAPASAPARFLSSRVMVQIGALSYSLYLVHQIALNAVEKGTVHAGAAGAVLEPAVGIPLGLALAYLLHISVERPFIRIGRRIAKHPVATPTEADEEAREEVHEAASDQLLNRT